MIQPTQFQPFSVAIAAGSKTTIVTPSSGKRIRFLGLMVSGSAAAGVMVQFVSGATVFRVATAAANAVVIFTPEFLADGILGGVDQTLGFEGTGPVTVTGTVAYREEP